MNRFLLSAAIVLSCSSWVHSEAQDGHSEIWRASCQFQKGSSISHTFNDHGRSTVTGNLTTEFDGKSATIKILKNTYTKPSDGSQSTVYFAKIGSISGENILSDTISPPNLHISKERLELFSGPTNLTLRHNETNDQWYGLLVYTDSRPHFDPPRILNHVVAAPVICT